MSSWAALGLPSRAERPIHLALGAKQANSYKYQSTNSFNLAQSQALRHERAFKRRETS